MIISIIMDHHSRHRPSPSLLRLLLSVFISSVAAVSSQLDSLLSLKSSLKDPLDTFRDWEVSKLGTGADSGWCSWTGVITCDPKTQQVYSLDISHWNISGVIPANIRYLTGLRHLNISGNQFTGPLPTAIFDLAFLQTLDISRNDFGSSFSPGISKLKYLTFFDAYSNGFVGTLPTEFVRLRFLKHLNLGGSYRFRTGYMNKEETCNSEGPG